MEESTANPDDSTGTGGDMVFNPYTKKRPFPEEALLHAPKMVAAAARLSLRLTSEAGASLAAAATATATAAAAAAADDDDEPSRPTKDSNQNTGTTTSSWKSLAIMEQEETEKFTAKPIPALSSRGVATAIPPSSSSFVVSSNSSSEVPLWQRLPSQTIAFGAAEVLTVNEVSRRFFGFGSRWNTTKEHPVGENARKPPEDDAHAASSDSRIPSSSSSPPPAFATMGKKGGSNRSIRVTGVIQHRHVHSDASLSLVLADPLSSLVVLRTEAPSMTTTKKRPRSILKHSTMTHPYSNNTNNNTSDETATTPLVSAAASPVPPVTATPAAAAAVTTTTLQNDDDDDDATQRQDATTKSTPHSAVSAKGGASTTTATAPFAVSSSSTTKSATTLRPTTTTTSILLHNKKKTLVYTKRPPSAGRRLSFAPSSGMISCQSHRTSLGGSGWRHPHQQQQRHSDLVDHTDTPHRLDAAPLHPLEALVQAIAGGSACSRPTVWIVVPPSEAAYFVNQSSSLVSNNNNNNNDDNAHGQSLVANDLAMVIGEIHQCRLRLPLVNSSSSTAAPLSSDDVVGSGGETTQASYSGKETSTASHKTSTAALFQKQSSDDDDDEVCCEAIKEVQKWMLGQQQQHDRKVVGDAVALSPCYYLIARIVRNANGTNMALYTDALMARRTYLQHQQEGLQQLLSSG